MERFDDRTLVVPKLNTPERLDTLLARLMDHSKRRLRRAIDEGGVYLNGKRTRKAGGLLKGGEKLRVVLLEGETLLPFDPSQIVWQQKSLILIHKKAGQYAQEALHRSVGTLPLEIAAHLGLAGEAARNLRPVHRLDRATSGLMLLSADPKELQRIQQHWAEAVEKSYLAVVEPAPLWESQRILLPISGERDKLGRYRVVEDGTAPARACDTEAEVLERRGNRALLRLIPHTGRTHQLRVHLAHLGHPILGDGRYGGVKHPRTMLHAHTLCMHPAALSATRAWVAEPTEDWTW